MMITGNYQTGLRNGRCDAAVRERLLPFEPSIPLHGTTVEDYCTVPDVNIFVHTPTDDVAAQLPTPLSSVSRPKNLIIVSIS